MFFPGVAYTREMCLPVGAYTREMCLPVVAYTREMCLPGIDYTREICLPGVGYTREIYLPGVAYTREMGLPGVAYTREMCLPGVAYTREAYFPDVGYTIPLPLSVNLLTLYLCLLKASLCFICAFEAFSLLSYLFNKCRTFGEINVASSKIKVRAAVSQTCEVLYSTIFSAEQWLLQ